MTRFTILVLPCLALLLGSAAFGHEPLLLAEGDGSFEPKQPQLAVDEEGVVHGTFGSGNGLFYCRSNDGGKSFESRVELPGESVLALGMRRGPRIAAHGHGVCIAAVGGRQGKGRDGDVLAYRSIDGGATFAKPVLVNDVSGSAREGLHALAGGPSGELCCVWLDLRNKKTEICASISKDGGGSWGDNVLVYQSPGGSVCECCHPSVAYDNSGKLHVMWRNSLEGARDMYRCESTNGGATFGKALKLGNGTWPLDACPMDGGHLAISPQGEIVTAWRRDGEVFVTRGSATGEKRLGVGRQPWIAATTKGPVVAWLEDRSGKLLLQRPAAKRVEVLAQKANDPVVAAAPDGEGLVVAAWEEKRGTNSVLMFQVLDGGEPVK